MPGLEVDGLAEVEDSVQWLQSDLAERSLVQGSWGAVDLWEDFESIPLPGLIVPVQINLGQALFEQKTVSSGIDLEGMGIHDKVGILGLESTTRQRSWEACLVADGREFLSSELLEVLANILVWQVAAHEDAVRNPVRTSQV